MTEQTRENNKPEKENKDPAENGRGLIKENKAPGKNNKYLKKKILLPAAIIAGAAALACVFFIIRAAGGRRNAEEQKANECLLMTAASDVMLDNESTVIYKSVTPEYVFTYAENQTEDYPTTQAGYRFAQLVNIRSKGRIRVRIYANAYFGNENSSVEQVINGGIDFVRVSESSLAQYSEKSTVLMLPYLYRNSEHMWKVLDGDIGQEIMNSFTGSGFTPMSFYDAGVRNFYTTKPVESIDDLAGMKIRVQSSDIMKDMVKELGAVPVPVDYQDVYSELEKGAVDGAENNWSSYEAMEHYKVAPFFVLDEHMRVPEMQIISSVTLNELSDEDAAMIFECAKESAEYQKQLWNNYEERARNEALSNGCQEITLSAYQKNQFKNAVAPLYEKYCGDYMDLIQAIEEMGE